jgi:NAD(P)-dependent dehydrogenase (short-subunit alcohol dehydrogenase family)
VQSAVDSMTRSLALEWGSYGIRVVGVAPGPIKGTPGELGDPQVKIQGTPSEIEGPPALSRESYTSKGNPMLKKGSPK